MRQKLINLISVASFVFLSVFASAGVPVHAAQPAKEGVSSVWYPNWNCNPGYQDECTQPGATGWTKPSGITDITIYNADGNFGIYGSTNGGNFKLVPYITGAGQGCSWGYQGGYQTTHYMCYGFSSAQQTVNVNFSVDCPWLRALYPTSGVSSNYTRISLYNANSPWQLLANFDVPLSTGPGWCHS